ncbi:hypothetical protein LINGRAHAP2_LOCUS21373 [Linum grandiflorum]
MRLLIGKGIWDDIFPLDGGGQVHLKLQFFLSEDDRQRIRIMRESALRKKHDELVSSKSASMAQKVERDHSAQTNSSPNGTERCEETSSNHVKQVKKERSVVFESDGSELGTISKRPKPLEKAHGTVRNMISAFESSGHQDTRSKLVRQQITKSQSVNNFVVDVDASKSKMQKVRSTDSLSEQLSSCLTQPDTAENEKDMENIARPEMQNVTTSTGSVTGLNETGKMKFLQDLDTRKTASARASFSSLGMKRQTSSGDMISRKSDSRIRRREICSYGDDHRSPECSGAWIYPDQGRRLCVTTAGKQVLNVIGGFCCETNRIEHFVAQENGEDGETEIAQGSSSRDVETRRGPVGQVMRVAIMAGFAALVVFTRQRNQ